MNLLGNRKAADYQMAFVTTNVHRDHTGREFADMIADQFDEMIEQCEQQPLVMSVALHPFICGQPFRLRALRKALKHCLEHKRKETVWFTSAGKIAQHCLTHPIYLESADKRSS